MIFKHQITGEDYILNNGDIVLCDDIEMVVDDLQEDGHFWGVDENGDDHECCLDCIEAIIWSSK